MFDFFPRSFPDLDYDNLIATLELNNPPNVGGLLFRSKEIDYLPATYAMLAKMTRPEGSPQKLAVNTTHRNGKYELVIFEVPWNKSDVKFLPLIFDKKQSKIIGVMLPFNELLPVLTQKEQKQINKLSMIWMGFIMQKTFGTK